MRRRWKGIAMRIRKEEDAAEKKQGKRKVKS